MVYQIIYDSQVMIRILNKLRVIGKRRVRRYGV